MAYGRFLLGCIQLITCTCLELETVKQWHPNFPDNSGIGLFVAIGIPIGSPNRGVFLTLSFEANYRLPDNSTKYDFPTIKETDNLNPKYRMGIDRNMIYEVLALKMKTFKLPGEFCLQRLICEASISSFSHNGVLGDIMHLILTYLQLWAACAVVNLCSSNGEHTNWAWHFPQGSNMGLYAAVAVPIDIPNENVFAAYNFEANYLIPGNESETVQIPPILPTEEARYRKTIDRASIYRTIEIKLESLGYTGQNCFLRMICEAAASHFHHNGVLGDIFHIILTPSSSVNLKLPKKYERAEKYGKRHGECIKYSKTCTINFLNLVTWLSQI